MVQHEFLRTGMPLEKMDAAMSELLADRIYLLWGIAEVQGFFIDNEPACVSAIVERGPETLSSEMIEAIQREIGLTKEEEKNS